MDNKEIFRNLLSFNIENINLVKSCFDLFDEQTKKQIYQLYNIHFLTVFGELIETCNHDKIIFDFFKDKPIQNIYRTNGLYDELPFSNLIWFSNLDEINLQINSYHTKKNTITFENIEHFKGNSIRIIYENLNSPEVQKIPSRFPYNIKKLRIKANLLEIPNQIYELNNLKDLDLIGNNLLSLPEDLSERMPNLENLRLTDNVFIGVKEVIKFSDKNPKIKIQYYKDFHKFAKNIIQL